MGHTRNSIELTLEEVCVGSVKRGHRGLAAGCLLHPE
jgi:hypothetical protein